MDDDDELKTIVDPGASTHAIPGVGSVTIDVVSGRLVLVGWTAPGWTLERQRVEADRVELELVKGEAEAEFEARLSGGGVEVEVEVDSD